MTRSQNWQSVCSESDLIANSGIAALVNDQQVALFYLPDQTEQVYAVSNLDPVAGANVISRGLIGDSQGTPIVIAPLYKQRYRLSDGTCLEDSTLQLSSWPTRLINGDVEICI